MDFLRNTWYVAAWGKEVAPGALFNRTILNDSIVFFRKEGGTIAAIGNRCPHRFAPLHMGKLKGDCVQCPYHGLEFDSHGQCTHNPHGDGAIPKAAQVKAYPVQERHLAIWIWMGDPSLADPDTIPDYSFLSRSKPTCRNTGYLPTRANYQLLCDNIMDLSHVDFLHPATLGGGALSRSKAEVTELAGKVRILWQAKNEVAPPAFAAHFPDPAAAADMWTDVIWSAPAQMHLSTGISPSDGSLPTEIGTENLHMMTPESDTTSHYFFANTRNFLQDDDVFNQEIDKVLVGIFAGEDKPLVEGQQQLMGTPDLWALKPLLLAPDAGAVRVRRVLEKMIQAERNAPPVIAVVQLT
jgi:vanillate O-demethylase monooxygenase subunit